MSAARVLHFGDDECHRLIVLQQAGYTTVLCRSGPQLVQEVQQADLDAVLFPRIPSKRISLQQLRGCTIIPFVLFGSPIDPAHPSPFDLVVDPMTDPEDWLQQLSLTIDHARRLRERSALIRNQSEALRTGSASLRRQSGAVRQEAQSLQQQLSQTRENLPRRPK